MVPAAQLLVERSGEVSWLRRHRGELWLLKPSLEGWRPVLRAVAAGSWLQADDRGAAIVEPPEPGAPAGAAGAPPATSARLRHPRTGTIYRGTVDQLERHDPDGARHVYPLSVAALAWSVDLRRLYVVSPSGEVAVVSTIAAAAAAEPGTPALPADVGPVQAASLAPAGLLLVTEHALVGVNLRTALATKLLDREPWLGRDEAAVALDHRGKIYLAGEHGVLIQRSDGSDQDRWRIPS